MPIPQLRNSQSVYRKDNDSSIRSRKNNKKNNKKWFLKLVFYIILTSILILLIGLFWISRDLPNPNELMNREVAQSTKIYDRTGENVLYEISGEQRRTLIQLKDIPNYVKNATIAVEDKNFYKHGGFSVWAMFRTLATNVIYRRSAGGSTLTQQFIKNAVLSNEKTITRKVKELIMAYQLEKKFSKDEILQMYLNEIPYGSNAYGVEAASEKYFGKNSKDLTLAEAATLAALPQSPSRYSPYGPNKDMLLGRKDYILDLMVEQGYVSAEERDVAKQQELVFKNRDNSMTAPHFVMYIKDILSEKYGEKMIEQGGLKIYTTLDLYKQKIAEEIIIEKTKGYAEKYNANNAALLSLDPKTGQILAMVGSRDYFNDDIDGQVNVTTRPRQPGSSMKPIVYAALFEKGYTPDTILYDVVTNFSTDSNQSYTPHNYNLREYGPVKIRQALAGSLNIPAVKAIYLAGINNVIDLAENLGYTTLYPRSRFGLSLVLGGGEVKMLEHVNAYSAFARDGQISPVVSILKIEDKDGKVIEEYRPSEKKALDSQVVRMINSILSDNAARTFIFSSKNYLNLGNRPVAAKTGTTNDYHDAWTIGYTPSLVTGVWVGNSNNDAMKGAADGSVIAAPIWHDYMLKVLGDTPIENFKAPADYKTGKSILDGQIPTQVIKVDKVSGLLASSFTPPEFIEEKVFKVDHNILFYVDKDNPRGPVPTNPASDPQFNFWEAAVKRWSDKNSTSSSSTIPTTYDESHNAENKPTIKISYPLENQVINTDKLDIQTESSAPRGVSLVEYYINNNLWQTKYSDPVILTSSIGFLANGYHTLKVRVCDNIKNCSEDSVIFNVSIKNNQTQINKNSIKLTSPNSGLALDKQDFPLPITLQISNPEKVYKINLISKNKNGQTIITNTILGSENIRNNNTINFTSAEVAGDYFLYGELYDWNGDTLKSNEISITVK